MRQLAWWILAATAALVQPAGAQTSPSGETLFVKRASDLRQGPADTAAVVAALPAQAPVSRLPERQGPWMRVKTEAGVSGWIHMFDVATVAPAATLGSTATGALRGLGNFFNRNSNTTTTATSTVGIRGLGAEDIANAQPNLQALQQAESLRASEAQAKRFATEAQLQVRAIEPLPAPQAPASPASPDTGFKTGGSK